MKTCQWGLPLLALPYLVGCATVDYILGEDLRASPLAVSASFAETAAPDIDKDGVPDASDDCPDSAQDGFVDVHGCELVTGVIEGLKFGPDEVVLSEESEIVLTTLIESFLRYPDITVSVDGHTDNRGSAADNLALSKQRVNAVVTFMIAKGMAPTQIKPFAYGESRPRAPNATLAGRERNRRIEIEVIERLL